MGRTPQMPGKTKPLRMALKVVSAVAKAVKAVLAVLVSVNVLLATVIIAAVAVLRFFLFAKLFPPAMEYIAVPI